MCFTSNVKISNKYKKLFTTWHCPISNDRKIEKKEEITFYPNGTYKSRKDNGYGILLETQGTYKLKYDCLYFKNFVYEIRINNNILTLREKRISPKEVKYETIKYFKLSNEVLNWAVEKS